MPGPVRSASIDASGAILSLTMEGVAAGQWSDYALAPDAAAPGVTIACDSAGFVRREGRAEAGIVARPLVALAPRRQTPIRPTSAIHANADILDEVDHGDGTRTVRLWLSRFVYQGDVATLSLGAGWRAGAPAQAGIAVANESALAAPPPIFRWITPPRQRVTGPFRVEMMAGGVNPVGRDGLAAIRFTVTDGSATREFWASGLSTAPLDGLRCWGATIDPAGLNPGLVTVHAELFPHVGPARGTGAGQSGIASGTDGAAAHGLVLAHDPAGTRYPAAWVMIDPVNGSSTANAAMVQPTLADAKGVAVKARAVTTAIQALYLANRSATAANGQPAPARMTDDARIVLPAGTSLFGDGTAVTTGASASECWPVVMGDPEDPDPRANCVLASRSATPNARIGMVKLQSLTLAVGEANLSTVAAWWLDDVTIAARPGQEASIAYLSTNSIVWYSRCATTNTANGFFHSGAHARPMLVRGCESPRAAQALAIVGSRLRALGGWGGIGSAESQADWICVGNEVPAAEGRAVNFATFTGGDGIGRATRALFLNNLIERIGSGPEPVWAQGENSVQSYIHVVIEGCTIVGERANTLYNDPPNLTASNAHVDCRVANSYFDWLPTKHDDFHDETTAGVNGGAPNHGYRPWLTDSLWFQAGVNCEGNALARRMQPQFEQRHPGLRAAVNPVAGAGGWAGFVDDRSRLGSDAGGGDYRPRAGSPLRMRGLAANLDVDGIGTARPAVFSTGAREGAG